MSGGGLSNATAKHHRACGQFLWRRCGVAVEILKEAPPYPQDEFDRLKTQRGRNRWKFRLTEPNQLANETPDPVFESIRGRATRSSISERVKNNWPKSGKQRWMTRRDFHDQFLRLQLRGSFAVVGTSLSGGTCRRLRADLLGTWNTARPIQEDGHSVLKKIAAINEKIETPDKANATVPGCRAVFQLSQDDLDYPAIVLRQLHVRRSPLPRTSPIAIRNREGLSYGANARITAPGRRKCGNADGNGDFQSGRWSESGVQLHGRIEEGFTARASAQTNLPRRRKAYLGGSQSSAAPPTPRLLNLIASHEQLDRPFCMGREPGRKDPHAHAGSGQCRIPQTHRSQWHLDRQGRRLQGRQRCFSKSG